jgi:hypothetical protein
VGADDGRVGATLCTAADLGRFLRAVIAADPPPAALDPAADREPPADAAPAELPGELAAMVGTYAAFNPWIPQVRIRPAGSGLVLVWPGDDEEPLTPLPDGRFGLGDDPASPDRVHFTAVVEGRPMQAVVSGWPFDRVE